VLLKNLVVHGRIHRRRAPEDEETGECSPEFTQACACRAGPQEVLTDLYSRVGYSTSARDFFSMVNAFTTDEAQCSREGAMQPCESKSTQECDSRTACR
jgi:hypothetical protein